MRSRTQNRRTPARPWQLLVTTLPLKTDLDEVREEDGRRWHATPHARFERLVRETGVHVGLVANGTHLRLVYAPRGESSGHLTFAVADMATVAGRPIFAALLMLLGEHRLFTADAKERLPALLGESRKYQNEVSTQLAGQVLSALFELLRGFQAADVQSRGELLHQVLADDPNVVYSGLLTVLLRLVFLLFAEDRGLISSDSTYVNHYSVTGLFDRLRADAGRNPDTMDQRFGAWAQLLTLFRIIHEGASHGGFSVPARKGYLFDPDRYPFLEGRVKDAGRDVAIVPRVADGVVFRVLSNLLLLKGERLSYRTLDVEQIGSVYEAIMGFHLETAQGPSIAIKPKKTHGASTTINLAGILSVATDKRGKRLDDLTEQKLTGAALQALAAAATIDDLVAALKSKVDERVTPHVVPKHAMILQPSDERRRSGSHYTPRILTGPIVRKTLEPVLKALGERPTPEQILRLKVCDPAMGSAAFLVEACRQLGDALVEAWHAHGSAPTIPPDEDEVLHARRLIAQRCLYGVDKNPLAVDLGKLSLWLATLARDHPFTFVDHALRHGDSLVGLTRKQIADFHWLPSTDVLIQEADLDAAITAATRQRVEIIEAGDDMPFLLKEQKLKNAEERLDYVRKAGNLVIAAFFAGDKQKTRLAERKKLMDAFTAPPNDAAAVALVTNAHRDLRGGNRPVQPFHWEIEFPEVFGRDDGGFDAMVGNPPFAGKNTIGEGNRDGYLDWLKAVHAESHGNADLVAHFFRRSFDLLRTAGTFGLIATNTIAQGDTRGTGLRWICTHGGTIYAARRRYKWPGQAAVVVSVIHVMKGATSEPLDLDGKVVPEITAYLFHFGGHDDPARLAANVGKSFMGCKVYGQGFTFDDADGADGSNSLQQMHELISLDARNAERIFPYIGGEEINSHPEQRHHRFVMNFGSMTEDQARAWPLLMQIVEEKVRPERQEQKRDARKKYWWRYGEVSPGLFRALTGQRAVLANSMVGNHAAFARLPADTVFAHTVNVFIFDANAALAALQSRPHEVWARFFASSMKDDLRYTPSDCFEDVPIPQGVRVE